MAPIPDRIPSPTAELILMLAKARVKRELAEEAKAKALADINRPPPDPNRPPDVFDIAKENYYARAELEAQLLAEIDREQLLRDAEKRKKREFQQLLKRARAAIGEERWRSVEAVWAARRRKQQR